LNIKEFIQEEVDLSIFPLKDLIDQYYFLGEEKWKDLDLTTSFLDVATDILESKIRKLFPIKKKEEYKKEDNIILDRDENWRELVPLLQEREALSSLIFRRNKKEEIIIEENEKINLTEFYILFLRKSNIQLDMDYLEEESFSIEDKVEGILLKKEGKFSELIKRKSKLDIVCYFLALCDLINRGRLKAWQEKWFGDIYFRVIEDERITRNA